MPTYGYTCEACGHEFEVFQSIKAAPIRKCPICARQKVRRQIGTGAGIIFKGSGFYQTDYRSDSYKQAAKSDAKPAASESKPAESAKTDTTAKSEKKAAG